MYSNPYSVENKSIFNDPFKPNYSEDRLNQMYQNLEKLKMQQIPQNQKTVFSEISAEFSDISEDEKRFIENNVKFITINDNINYLFERKEVRS